MSRSRKRTVPESVAALPTRLLTNDEAAAFFGLHRDTWATYWREHRDLIAGIRYVGKRRRWPLRVLEQHVEEVCR